LKKIQQGDIETIEPPPSNKKWTYGEAWWMFPRMNRQKKTPLVLLLIKQGYMNLSDTKLQVGLNAVFFLDGIKPIHDPWKIHIFTYLLAKIHGKSSWWFQPIQKILVKLEHFPK